MKNKSKENTLNLNILDFIKTGKWISSLGGLDKLKTNQILKDLRSGEILNKYFLH
jgi:anaerobic ribonucleoside-triphosphate reductase activating protein